MKNSNFAFFLCLLAGAFSGCSRGEETPTLVVFAASSLREAFAELGHGFELRNQGVAVRLNMAGSQILRMQLEQGARADVFASANLSHMQALTRANRVELISHFADNQLALIVPLANPAGIGNFQQLGLASRLIVGSAGVPVGEYTQQLFANAAKRWGAAFRIALEQGVVSRESNVRLVRAKVEMGQADAAIVYHTDAQSSPHVRELGIPEDINVRAGYVAAVVKSSRQELLARQFVEYLSSEMGRQVLHRHGFLTEKP